MSALATLASRLTLPYRRGAEFLPIPLGAIIAKRSLDLDAIEDWIRQSVEYAWAHPEASREYVLSHAQELDPDVAQQHIDLYVNDFTLDYGPRGKQALKRLYEIAHEKGIIPHPVDLEFY